MKTIYFDFNGRNYSGYILQDSNPLQNYLWFVFNDNEMIVEFGDSIAFRIRDGKIEPMYLYTKQADFIEYLLQKIEAAIQAAT